jgi:hypothetical protein
MIFVMYGTIVPVRIKAIKQKKKYITYHIRKLIWGTVIYVFLGFSLIPTERLKSHPRAALSHAGKGTWQCKDKQSVL